MLMQGFFFSDAGRRSPWIWSVYISVCALVKGYDVCTYLLTRTAHVFEQDDFQ